MKTFCQIGCARWGIGLLMLGLYAGSPSAAAAEAEERGGAPSRVVVVGDVHGDYDDFVSILQTTGLIDANRHWTGGAAVLVQTGDVPDRGPKTRASLDLLMDLERQAEKQKGKVLAVLGNHEIMNMVGDLRYVTPDDYRAFATDQSEKVRAEAFEDYKKFVKAGRPRPLSDDDATRQQWLANYPLGYFEQRDAFGPQGVYGRWLRRHVAIVQVGDGLFMHGGLDPKLHFKNIEELNKRINAELEKFDALWQVLTERKLIWRYMKLDEAIRYLQTQRAALQSGDRVSDQIAAMKIEELLNIQSTLLFAENSPLWYRGLSHDENEKMKPDVQKMLVRLKVRYLVAAHTVRPKFDITSHYDHQVFLIDTGMLKPYFGGRASALEIQDGRFTAYYAGGEKEVLLPVAGAAGGAAGGHEP